MPHVGYADSVTNDDSKGVDANLSPSTMTPRDPSDVSLSIRPMASAVTWATNGMGHASALGTTMIVPGYDPPVTTAATSACITEVRISYVTTATVSITSAVGSPVRPIVGSGITAITDCSVTSEGIP